MAAYRQVQRATHRATLLAFAAVVLGLYTLIWGAELLFPRSMASAIAVVAATALGAWLVRPGWNLRPRPLARHWLALLALLVVSAAVAAWFLSVAAVPIPYDVSTGAIARAIPAVLVVTGIEELLFRQVLYRWLERRQLSSRSIVGATALAFAGAHLGPIFIGSSVGATFHLLQSGYMVWVGFLLGRLRNATGSWPMAWLGHFVYNVTILYVLSLLTRGGGG